MELKELKECAKGFETILKLKTKPLGIKFFKSIDEVPQEYEWVEKKKAICNLCGFSRFYEIPIAITAENTKGLCVVEDVSLFGPELIPPMFPQNAAGKFAKDAEQTPKIVEGMKTMPFEFAAIGICPLEISPVIPDVVQIWGNPTQIMELEYANVWNDGAGKFQLCTNGHGASCYEALTWPIVTHEIRLAVADIGDKRHGYAGDNDMILGVPTDMIPSLYDGLVATQKTLNKLPILYNFDDIDFPIPGSVLGHCPALKK